MEEHRGGTKRQCVWCEQMKWVEELQDSPEYGKLSLCKKECFNIHKGIYKRIGEVCGGEVEIVKEIDVIGESSDCPGYLRKCGRCHQQWITLPREMDLASVDELRRGRQ